MSRNAALIFAALLSLSLTATSEAGVAPTTTATILPEDCRLLVGEELSLVLDGFIPPDTAITWDANKGGITAVLPGVNAVFVAPPEPTLVTISVSISPVAPGRETLITRQCIITSRNSAPNGLAQATGMDTIGMSLSSLRPNSAAH